MKKAKIKMVSLTFFAILVIAVLVCYYLFHIDTIHVEGSQMYTESDVINSVFTRKFSDNELMFRFYNKIFGINKLPFIEQIDVTYDNRNTVTLTVYDKTISGCVKYLGQYVYFDKDGIVLQSLPEYKEGVPIVTGIKFGDFVIGEKFAVKDSSVFDAVMNVSLLINHYGIHIERIHVNDGSITLYAGKVIVDLGKRKMYDDQMAALSDVLDKTEKKNLSGTINMKNYKSGDRIILKQ